MDDGRSPPAGLVERVDVEDRADQQVDIGNAVEVGLDAGGQVVEGDDLVDAVGGPQLAAQVGADEAGTPGYDDLHQFEGREVGDNPPVWDDTGGGVVITGVRDWFGGPAIARPSTTLAATRRMTGRRRRNI